MSEPKPTLGYQSPTRRRRKRLSAPAIALIAMLALILIIALWRPIIWLLTRAFY